MANVNSQGTTLKVGDGATVETFTTVPGVTAVTGLRGGQAQVIPVSTLSSTRVEKIMGLADEGQATVNLIYDPDDAQQAALETARANGTLKNFQVVLTDDTPSTLAFAGFVSSFSVDIGVDTVVTGTVTIEITGEVTKT